MRVVLNVMFRVTTFHFVTHNGQWYSWHIAYVFRQLFRKVHTFRISGVGITSKFAFARNDVIFITKSLIPSDSGENLSLTVM